MDVLKDKSYKRYERTSRYSAFPYYYNTQDNKFIYGTTAHLLDSTGYTLHTIAMGDSLDSLALKYYNNPTYYWAIADFNRIQDPFKQLEIGSSIKIPLFANLTYDI